MCFGGQIILTNDKKWFHGPFSETNQGYFAILQSKRTKLPCLHFRERDSAKKLPTKDKHSEVFI